MRRLLLAIVLGFLIPLSDAFLLFEADDLAGKPVPEFLVAPFGWPRPLWIFLMGRQPLEDDLVGGLVFIALCNIALYGTIVYAALLGLSLVRRKPTVDDPPPLPEPHDQEMDWLRAAGNTDGEHVSINEAKRRYDAFSRMSLRLYRADAVMARARDRLK